jgi:hypothetical protein
MKKVKIFRQSNRIDLYDVIEKSINEWLSENKEIKILEMAQSEGYSGIQITILYVE